MTTTVTKRTINISGFGGGYEDTCQRMLWKGVAWLAEAKPPVEMWERAKQYRNIIGVMTTEGDDLKALEEAAMAGEPDVTGAMHQAVMNHLAYIHKRGVDTWVADALEDDPSRALEWTGSLMPEAQP